MFVMKTLNHLICMKCLAMLAQALHCFLGGIGILLLGLVSLPVYKKIYISNANYVNDDAYYQCISMYYLIYDETCSKSNQMLT